MTSIVTDPPAVKPAERRGPGPPAAGVLDAVCTWCLNRGLECRPFTGPDGGRRVLAVCLRCGHAEDL